MSPVPVNVALQGYEDVIESVIGSGAAISNVDGQWFGSIDEFQVGDAYYIEVAEYVDFQWGGISVPTTQSTTSGHTDRLNIPPTQRNKNFRRRR